MQHHTAAAMVRLVWAMCVVQDYAEGRDGTRKADAWRHAACVAVALPTSLRDSLLERLVPLGPHLSGEPWLTLAEWAAFLVSHVHAG